MTEREEACIYGEGGSAETSVTQRTPESNTMPPTTERNFSASAQSACTPVASAVQWLCMRNETDALLDLRTEAQRRLVMNKLDAMLRIEAGIVSGLSRQKSVEAAARLFTGRRGFSVGSIVRDFSLWANGGRKLDASGSRRDAAYAAHDWRVFVPGYNNGHPDAALANTAFTRYVRHLHADTCREDATGNALQARLLDKWFEGREIPGYGNLRNWNARRGQPVRLIYIRVCKCA